MIIRDYNGTGIWSAEGIQRRYQEYAEQLNIKPLRDVTPDVSEDSNTRWIYPVMHKVIEGIEADDAACILIGIEFIEEDQSFTFGPKLKSNTARALRRARLPETSKRRIRQRVATMLLNGYVPQEYTEYAKLLRRLGVSPIWSRIEDRVDLDKWRVRRFYNYFRTIVRSEQTQNSTGGE